MPPHRFLGQPQLDAEPAHFILEKVLERLDQLEAELLGQAANVVMRLDIGGRAVGGGAAFDHVRIKRALGQEASVVDVPGLVPKNVN